MSLDEPEGVEVVHVRSAREMLEASRDPFARSDIAVFTAAVADMRPASSDRKLKKGVDDELLTSISLVENPDILATLAAASWTRCFCRKAPVPPNVRKSMQEQASRHVA